MSNVSRFFIVMMVLGGHHFPQVHAESLCVDHETILFNCKLPSKTASLCKSKSEDAVTYRFGDKSRIDLEISDADVRQRKIFYFSSTSYAGGGEAHIRFSRARYTYYLYDKTVKTDGGYDFSAGIVVFRGRVKIADHICTNVGSIRGSAYVEMTREKYSDISGK